MTFTPGKRRFKVDYATAGALLALGSLAPATASASTSQPIVESPNYAQVIIGDAPIMYWRLGERTGNVATDSSGNSRDAWYAHRPHLGLNGAIVNDPDTAVGFDGQDDLAGWQPVFSHSGPFSVEAWVGTRRDVAYQTFFSTRGLCPGACVDYSFDIKLEHTSGYGIRVDVGDGSRWLVTETFPFAWATRTYYHVVAVASGTGLTLFVDGAEIGGSSYAQTSPLLFDHTHKVQIGVANATGGAESEWFGGLVDEVAVYDYALTAEQVADHFAAGIGP